MPLMNVLSPDFEKTVTENEIVLVDFWAAWCGPCRMFAPIFEEAANKYPDITFAKVDTDAEQQLAAAAQITSIPTLMAFRDGILVFRQAGALPAAQFEEFIQEVKKLNMDEVRAEIAKNSESES